MDTPIPGNHHSNATNDKTQAFLEQEAWLRRVLSVRLQNNDAVDEVLQEVAIAVAKSKNIPVDAFEPWLCRVAIRQALLYRRRRDRQKRLCKEYSVSSSARKSQESLSDPLLWMLAGERRKSLELALEQLKPADSEILLLKYVNDWNYQQICEHLRISHSAVANRLRTARERLRTLLEMDD